MFSARIRSALFIDYENVANLCPPDRIYSWLQWIEEGGFDENKRRRLVRKNIYWGSKDNQHVDAFEEHGFKVTLCEKFHMLKNGADITIALDVMETILADPKIEEFIILAKDTDYVPVIQRLQANNRRSAILVDENQERVFGVYYSRADVVIPVRILKNAASYPGPDGPWARFKNAASGKLVRITRSLRRQEPEESAMSTVEQVATEQRVPSEPQALPAEPAYRPTPGAIRAAVRAVIRATQSKPNKYTSHKDIQDQLVKTVQGFTKRGPQAYLGYGTFNALMRALEPLAEGRIEVTDAPYGGISIRYIPKDED